MVKWSDQMRERKRSEINNYFKLLIQFEVSACLLVQLMAKMRYFKFVQLLGYFELENLNHYE